MPVHPVTGRMHRLRPAQCMLPLSPSNCCSPGESTPAELLWPGDAQIYGQDPSKPYELDMEDAIMPLEMNHTVSGGSFVFLHLAKNRQSPNENHYTDDKPACRGLSCFRRIAPSCHAHGSFGKNHPKGFCAKATVVLISASNLLSWKRRWVKPKKAMET